MKSTLGLLCSAALLAISFHGCKKDNAESADDTSQAVEFEQIEQTANDVDNMSDEAFLNGDVNMRLSAASSDNSILSCATVTNDTVAHILTIDFGTGCTGHDGRTRSGQVIVAYNGHYYDPGFSRSITFNNFFVDSNQISGTRSIVNNGTNAAGNLTWTITATGLRITHPNGKWHEWSSTRTRELVEGSSTMYYLFDDVYLITGSGTASNSNGRSVTITITSPLRKELACHWIVSGTVEIAPLNLPVRTLDYGSGACDRQATVTVNGVTKTILLH